MSIRILHIFGCMNRGGAEMRTLDLMRRIDSKRFQIDFCALSGRPGLLDDDIRKLGGHVHLCKLRSITFNRRFCELLHTGKYDVVHSHVHYFSGYILWLANRCGVSKRIAHFRNTTDTKSKTFKRRLQTTLMRRLINKNSTRILAVGEGAMQAGWCSDWRNDHRCTVIPNGLDTAPFKKPFDHAKLRSSLNVSQEATLVIHVGRMAKQKNHLRLASIASELLLHDQSIHFLLAGQEDAEIKNKMLVLFDAKNLSNRVHFLGVRKDVPQLLLISDLVIFPSLWEGLPGSVLEACAAGTPVLASDILGTREVAETFSKIHLLNLEQTNQIWAQEAMELLTHRPCAEERKAALEFFRETPYDIEASVTAHVQAWEHC